MFSCENVAVSFTVNVNGVKVCITDFTNVLILQTILAKM